VSELVMIRTGNVFIVESRFRKNQPQIYAYETDRMIADWTQTNSLRYMRRGQGPLPD
jgi:hypothetical protein